jgi:hypothetical protein
MADIAGHGVALIKIINEENISKFAEIGVWKGRTCRRILKFTSLDEYWAVDPWEVMDEKEATSVQSRREQWQWEAYHRYVCRLMPYYPQLKVLRMSSKLASEVIPDKRLCMVYIDAIHTFEHVWDDISYWLPKVRKGGILGGHDYYSGENRKIGVKRAVDKWFGKDVTILEDNRIWLKRV